MKVIILFGGRATRLPHSAKKIPKALVKVRGKEILFWQLALLKKHGLNDIRLAIGFRAKQIAAFLKKKKIKVEYKIEKEPLQTGGAIKFASSDLREPFMAVNGDILTDLNLKKFVEFHQKIKARNSIAVWYTKNAFSYGVLKIRKNGLVEKFLEKPKKKIPGYINAGYYILSPDVFKKIKKRKFLVETEVFPKLAQQKELYAFVHCGKWIDVGTEERLKFARNYLELK